MQGYGIAIMHLSDIYLKIVTLHVHILHVHEILRNYCSLLFFWMWCVKHPRIIDEEDTFTSKYGEYIIQIIKSHMGCNYLHFVLKFQIRPKQQFKVIRSGFFHDRQMMNSNMNTWISERENLLIMLSQC